MSGIVFLGTRNLTKIRNFYMDQVGADLWLEQADCIILKQGNILLGFCQREKCDTGGIITFFYPTRKDVDDKYRQFGETASDKPKVNEKYNIYHFFASDPEGRTIEFQAFLHPVQDHIDGSELLLTRRSVRHFEDHDVPGNLQGRLFELCRFSPTSCNSESYYFMAIRDRKIMEFLASTRGSSSAPISRAPMAVAICSDPAKTKRPIQDGCIAAYHFLLAAWNLGLGTCWIAAMDRDDVKERIGIPQDHYIATITPLGFPSRLPDAPSRREADEMIRIIE